MRAMLDLPNRPAVLWMHMWNLNIPFTGGMPMLKATPLVSQGVRVRLSWCQGGSCIALLQWGTTWLRVGLMAFAGIEDIYSSIFNYYGVTALSERNAMHQMVREQDILHDKMYNGRGNFHPNCVGTRSGAIPIKHTTEYTLV